MYWNVSHCCIAPYRYLMCQYPKHMLCIKTHKVLYHGFCNWYGHLFHLQNKWNMHIKSTVAVAVEMYTETALVCFYCWLWTCHNKHRICNDNIILLNHHDHDFQMAVKEISQLSQNVNIHEMSQDYPVQMKSLKTKFISLIIMEFYIHQNAVSSNISMKQFTSI